MATSELSRRDFLARIGVLGASATLLPSCAWPGSSGELSEGEASSELLLETVVALLRPVLAQLSRDTWNGFVAFSLPGQDAYSRAQGTPRGEPGGIEAKGADFLIDNLDQFLPLPDELVRPAARGLVTALHDLPLPPLPLLGPLLPPIAVPLGSLSDAVFAILQNDTATPLSLPAALLLNNAATMVSPAAINGAFLSPFARLTFAQKAKALELIETSQSNLVALIDAQLAEPLRSSVSGLLKFLGGSLYEFAAFGALGESRFYDRRTKQITSRPVGWQLTGFLPDNQPGDGWDDLIGYYQDRREVSDV